MENSPSAHAVACCPICNGNASHKTTMPIDAKTFRPTPHGKIYECSACGLGFVHPRPSSAETLQFYDLDTYYTQGASHMVVVDNPSLSSRLRMHLAWRVDAGEQLLNLICAALKPPATIVDIGCGGGALLAELTCRGYQAIGVERDPHSLALRDKRLTVLEGSAEILPLALRPGSCDGVVFSHVIEHLSDPVATLRSAAVLLKPTGLLFCEVPNNESMIARQSGLAWEHLDIPRHINFFNERSLVNVVLSAGFKVNRTHFSGFCRVFSDSYIATEKRIFDQLENNNRISILAKRNSDIRSWSLLARTAFSDSREKYDSVGIIASLG